MTSQPLRLCKTAKAWARLAQQPPLNRAVLLLANGQRSEQEISLLLGSDVSDLTQGLLMQGYLQPAVQSLFDDGWDDTQGPLPAHASVTRRPTELKASV